MLSLRRSIFRSLKPGAIYVAPPVLQQQRARAFQAVASLAESNVIIPRAPSPPFARIGVPQSRWMSTETSTEPVDSQVSMESVTTPATQAESTRSDQIQAASASSSVYSNQNTQFPADQPNPVHRDLSGNALKPSKRIYVGNISYGIRAEDLEREFSEFGKVVASKIIYDPRGLSKGFGYVEFEEQSAATNAVEKMHGLIVDGRRINVQYVLRPERGDTGFEENSPSKTLFIGNLSFDITDKDLNELFADVRNCTDVRVAIDRRTGQPRGFAHADFIDISSAQLAKGILEGKSIYGRTIRIDYTKNHTGQKGGAGRSFANSQ